MIAVLGNTVRDMINKNKTNGGLVLVGVFLEIATSILLVMTAIKDPATIPTRKFLSKAFKRKSDFICIEEK